MGLSADELSTMRAALLETLTDTCTIQRKAIVESGRGRTTAYTNHAASVACRFAPFSGQRSAELVQGGAVTSVFDGIFTFSHTQDVTETDRIIWSTKTFEVVKARPRTNAVSLRVEVKLVA